MSCCNPDYDRSSRDSILSHARKLLGHSLKDLHPEASANSKGRGGLGRAVEKFHFDYEPNSEAAPDFAEAGLELKCTPLKLLNDGSTVAKERLVLNIINYLDESKKDFSGSSFWKKNQFLLLMFYLHEAGKCKIDLLFKLIRNWSIPPEDMEIFREDWVAIHEKIVSGRAHEIHEGDTFYLAACEKGSAAGVEMRSQSGTSIKAQQRAYSIKKCYLDQIILESLTHPEMISGIAITNKKRLEILNKRREIGSIARDADEYRAASSFSDYVVGRFRGYIGMSVRAIADRLSVDISSPKSMSYSLCRAILGVREKKIAEFEKAGVILKTVRLSHDGGLKEAMSFCTIKYREIVNEEVWSDSEWYGILTSKFFFVVFRKSRDNVDAEAVLEDVFFWSMPMSDLNKAREFWIDTRDKVRAGDYEHFMRSAEHPVCHVRPKAKNAMDVTETPQGGFAKKKCYWLNRSYVLNVVNSHMEAVHTSKPSVLQDVADELKYFEYLPLYSMRAACGAFGSEELVEPDGWVKVRGVRARNEHLYVVRAIGQSMAPRILDGEYKVFEFRNGSCNSDEIVLVEHVGVVDGETAGAYSIKKFREKTVDGIRVEATLVPINKAYSPIPLLDVSGNVNEYRVVGTMRDNICVA